MSFVDVNRQWFKSRVGFDCNQTHRNVAFCAYTILPGSPEVLVVNDATEDERFRNNPLVTGPPYIRFYAGAALVVSGVRIGSLCILDTVPRHDFDLSCKMNLLDLGEAVAGLIRERRENNVRADEQRTKLMMDAMHNIRTPLMSLGLACSILTAQAEEMTEIVSQSPIPSQVELATHFAETLADVQSSVGELKLSVESNICFHSIMLQNAASSIDGKTQPIPCDVLERIEYVKKILADTSSSRNLKWNIDTSILSQGKHLSHPNAIVYVLISTLSKANTIWDNIVVNIYFDHDINGSAEYPENFNVENIPKNALVGVLKIKIKVFNRSFKDNISVSNTHNLFLSNNNNNNEHSNCNSTTAKKRYGSWEFGHTGKLLSDLLTEQKAVHRVIKEMGGVHRNSLNSSVLRLSQIASRPLDDEEDNIKESQKDIFNPIEEFEYSIPCYVLQSPSSRVNTSIHKNPSDIPVIKGISNEVRKTSVLEIRSNRSSVAKKTVKPAVNVKRGSYFSSILKVLGRGRGRYATS